jgi:hypothetical protein
VAHALRRAPPAAAAWRLELAHPVSGDGAGVERPLDAVWNSVLARFGWTQAVADAFPVDR